MASAPLMKREQVLPAVAEAFRKLDVRTLVRNPVMFTTSIAAMLATVVWLGNLASSTGDAAFEARIVVWLWLTVLFGNFAESLAEGRGVSSHEQG